MKILVFFSDYYVKAISSGPVTPVYLGLFLPERTLRITSLPTDIRFFDCGAAWMALTLQANKFGLYTHGMGGIKRNEVCAKLNVPEDYYEVVCGFALGVIDSPDMLSEDLAEREVPSQRKSLPEIWKQGKLPS